MTTYKRLAAVGVATVATLGIAANAYANTNFTDVSSSHWAYSYISKASDNGWVTGKGNNLYDPEGNVTTAEFYTLLARAFYGSEIPTTAQSGQWYSDKWYAPYFEVGVKHSFDAIIPNKIDCIEDIEKNTTRSGMAGALWVQEQKQI